MKTKDLNYARPDVEDQENLESVRQALTDQEIDILDIVRSRT